MTKAFWSICPPSPTLTTTGAFSLTMAAAFRCWPPAHARTNDDLSDLAYAHATSAGRNTEMRDQGTAFGQLIAILTGVQPPALPYPIAVGHAARSFELPTQDVLAVFLQALAAQLVSAAVRFVPLGTTDGQKVLAALTPLITTLAATCATEPLSALSSATFGADLAQMRHETLDVRIFRS